jgi:hypothetical protein
MKLRACALGLLAGVLSGIAVAGGAGVARADPATDPGPAPGIINQILTETPDLFVDPRDEGGQGTNSDRVGMYCENLFVRCR